MKNLCWTFLWSIAVAFFLHPGLIAEEKVLTLKDIFNLEYASDPQLSPDGKKIVYVRNSFDIMKDRRHGKLWILDVDGTNHRPLTSSEEDESSPRWSPRGDRLAYLTKKDKAIRLVCRWMNGGASGTLADRLEQPEGVVWSRDGKSVAYVHHVKVKPKPFVQLPEKPEGAEWAEPAKVIADVHYRHDGKGYRVPGHRQLFVVSAEGGTPRQVTTGEYDVVGTPTWSANDKWLAFTSQRRKDSDYTPLNTEIYRVSLASLEIEALTDRQGPDHSPVYSPDGKSIAYIGFDDKRQGHQLARLYVMHADGNDPRSLTVEIDLGVGEPRWSPDGKSMFVQYDRQGVTQVGSVTLDGKMTSLVKNVGGTTIGRPYSSGSYSVANDGTLAFTQTSSTQLGEVAVRASTQPSKRLTSLNADVFANRRLASVEEIWYTSSHDRRKIQGWIVKPTNFDAKKKYPLILEIHGGPFANYGPRFSVEMQLYAAAGYVVFYANPRGSTGYGEEFGNLIHHAYPGFDYDDLMSGVDAVLDKGYIDEKNLFVTGGSGGGVLSSWIVGKTNRFRAAVVAKPVINWYSFVLNADVYPFFAKYWFPGPPWQHAEHYLARSPISLVGNVQTPTMLLTGEKDHRTPISESEQFYQALKLRKVETMLVRIPGASHNIAARPSQLIAKIAYVLKWFELHKEQQ